VPGQESTEIGEPASTDAPGWPLPEKVIPRHEAGRPVDAGSYTTWAEKEDENGLMSAVQLSGVEAMVADGLDPLLGNYRLVGQDSLLRLRKGGPANSMGVASFRYEETEGRRQPSRSTLCPAAWKTMAASTPVILPPGT
jgi:hypothetical protein